MIPPEESEFQLGPLLADIANSARWRDDPAEIYFPSSQRVADEHERYLEFAKSSGQWDRLAKRLRDCDRTRRDETFVELAVALMFHDDGFPVIRWEPPGANEKLGEYEIDGGEESIFVEVKSPGWESELDKKTRSERIKLPKYINAEARFIDQVTPIRYSIAKALPKFSGTMPSLLVIADDLWLGLEIDSFSCEIALFGKRIYGEKGYSATDGPFVNADCPQIGGVMFFWISRYTERPIAPGCRVYLNPFASERAQLPERFRNHYRASERPLGFDR